MDEKTLIAEAQSGDREALGLLLLAHRDACYAFALRLSRRPEDAEDLCQESFARAAEKLPAYRGTGTLRSWLLGMVVNVRREVLDSERARRRREGSYAMEREAVGVETRSALERADLRRQLDLALARLDESYRLPIVLTHEQGLTSAEAAAVLSMPEGTVKTNVRRGLEELRGLLARAGYAGAALSVVEGALAQAPAVSVPASLTAFIKGLAVPGGAKAAAPAGAAGAAMKGGLIVKVGLGVAAAGLVAGGVFWAVGGRSGEPAKSPSAEAPAPAENKEKKKSKFDTPIWDPGAEWEAAGRFLAVPYGASTAWLDGPREEIMFRDTVGPWGSYHGSDERCAWGCLDEKTDQFHTVAGAGAFGYLDGPFSRARHGGQHYFDGRMGFGSPDKRYVYRNDPVNGGMLRRLDFQKQVVETIQIEGNPIPRGVTIGGPANQIFMIPRGSDQLLTFNADFKIEKKMKLEKVLSREDAGEQSLCLALDPKHNRLYASGEYDPKRKWHVWYWDLNDGSFHGEVAAKEGKPGDPMFGGLPGSYKDGWYVYPASGVWFGPDDPEYRFLYTSHTDCGNSHRLDLEKKEVWAMNGPPRGKGGPIKYIFSGPMVGFQPHVGPGWLDNGDFVIPVGGSKRLGLYLYRRVK